MHQLKLLQLSETSVPFEHRDVTNIQNGNLLLFQFNLTLVFHENRFCMLCLNMFKGGLWRLSLHVYAATLRMRARNVLTSMACAIFLLLSKNTWFRRQENGHVNNLSFFNLVEEVL